MNQNSFILLNSFDRSGSTLIAKALAEHPKIECLYNPFNSSVFRKEFMMGWGGQTDMDLQREGREIFNNLLNGNINDDTIKSGVFFSNSSASVIEEGKLYIIKTTNLHLKLAWVRENFPNIRICALLRNPLGIMASLVRNNFHNDWYGGWAFEELHEFIVDNYTYSVANVLASQKDELKRMAVIIGVLNSAMLKDVNHTIVYEDVVSEPNKCLNEFIGNHVHGPYDFAPFFMNSVNSVGKPFEHTELYREIFTEEQISDFCGIFALCGDLGYQLK